MDGVSVELKKKEAFPNPEKIKPQFIMQENGDRADPRLLSCLSLESVIFKLFSMRIPKRISDR